MNPSSCSSAQRHSCLGSEQLFLCESVRFFSCQGTQRFHIDRFVQSSREIEILPGHIRIVL